MQSIHGESSEYKLGTVFLRNFYTVLDYDDDLIAIGVNKGSAGLAKAEIEGHRENPKTKHKSNLGLGTFLLVLLVVFLIVGFVYLALWRRDIWKRKKSKKGKDEEKAISKDGQDEE